MGVWSVDVRHPSSNRRPINTQTRKSGTPKSAIKCEPSLLGLWQLATHIWLYTDTSKSAILPSLCIARTNTCAVQMGQHAVLRQVRPARQGSNATCWEAMQCALRQVLKEKVGEASKWLLHTCPWQASAAALAGAPLLRFRSSSALPPGGLRRLSAPALAAACRPLPET